MSRPFFIALVGLACAVAAAVLALLSGREEAGQATQVIPAPQADAQSPLHGGDGNQPTFDVVRVGEAGDTVIAGRAVAGAEVTVRSNERALGMVPADLRGEWVFVPDLPLEPGAHELTLEARNPDGTIRRSAEPVVVVVPAHDPAAAFAVEPLSGGGARLLQPPRAAEDAGLPAIDLIDHDGKGRLFVAGRSAAHAVLHLYLDNRFLGRAAADDQGAWHLTVEDAPKAGAHVLRADEVNAKGKVLARVEAPYTPSEDVAAGAGGEVSVQDGPSQWRITRGVPDRGPDYLVVRRAGKNSARDPERVYPGQVFSVPNR